MPGTSDRENHPLAVSGVVCRYAGAESDRWTRNRQELGPFDSGIKAGTATRPYWW